MENIKIERYKTNAEINKEHKRTGKCNRCGRRCKFALLNTINTKQRYKYLSGFVDIIKLDGVYQVIINKPCKYLTKDNKCSIFNSKKLPMACRQFPYPFDEVYLKVKKTCGFKFPSNPIETYKSKYRS